MITLEHGGTSWRSSLYLRPHQVVVPSWRSSLHVRPHQDMVVHSPRSSSTYDHTKTRWSSLGGPLHTTILRPGVKTLPLGARNAPGTLEGKAVIVFAGGEGPGRQYFSLPPHTHFIHRSLLCFLHLYLHPILVLIRIVSQCLVLHVLSHFPNT